MNKYLWRRLALCVSVLGFLQLGGCALTTPASDSSGPSAHTNSLAPDSAPRRTPAFTTFHGDFLLLQLVRLPERFRETPYGIIDRDSELEAIWPGFHSYDGGSVSMPSVDFADQLIVFVRNTQFYNRIHLGTVNIIEGKGEIVTMETRSALPLIDKASFAMMVLNRKDVSQLRFGDQWLALPQ